MICTKCFADDGVELSARELLSQRIAVRHIADMCENWRCLDCMRQEALNRPLIAEAVGPK